MHGLSDLLIARLQLLTADLLFDHKPTGIQTAPQVIEAFLPPAGRDWEEGQDHPLVRVAIYKGSFDLRPQTTSAVITGGIWTSGDVVAGTKDIMTLAEALGGIIKPRGYPPFRLVTPVDFYFGDQQSGQEGFQPHPYHYVTLFPTFILP